MIWFFAKIIFIIRHEEASSHLQFDEQLRLVQASNLQEALEKAHIFARQEEQEFKDSNYRKVSWKFLGIPELYPLGQLEDGKVICSFSPEADNPASYREYVEQKYFSLQRKVMHPGTLV